jgi:hypothetical protein
LGAVPTTFSLRKPIVNPSSSSSRGGSGQAKDWAQAPQGPQEVPTEVPSKVEVPEVPRKPDVPRRPEVPGKPLEPPRRDPAVDKPKEPQAQGGVREPQPMDINNEGQGQGSKRKRARKPPADGQGMVEYVKEAMEPVNDVL